MSENSWNAPDDNSTPPAQGRQDQQKEWKLIEKLLLASGKEQRRARRWGIAFKLLTFVYLFALLFLLTPELKMEGSVGVKASHTGLVDVRGVIAEGEMAAADQIVKGLRTAFDNKHSKAVILRINSPGGSPVQAGYVYDEIKRLRELHPKKRLYAVISDLGASGGYYIAAAADEIYADKASLVGSIGVISSSFGFSDAMKRMGVERRVFTAGESKAFLDPFSPMKEADTEFWQSVLDVTHRQFIAQVKQGRGDRLQEDPKLFSGLIWSGEQALELGLIDGLGSTGYVARDIIGEENIVDYTPKLSPFEQFTDRLGMSIGRTMANYFGAERQLEYR